LNETIYYRGAVNVEGLVNSKIHKLTVSSLPPRNLDVPGLDNARDIGGYKTNLIQGGIIKQGLYYRSARLSTMGDAGKNIISKLGIKREINLNEEYFNPNIKGITYHYIPMENTNENTRFDKYNQVYIKVFQLLSEADKYPIVLHCHAGADRTGVMSFALLALLGVEYKDIARDYAFTSFGVQGERYVKNSQLELWMKKLDKYEGKNLAEKCKNWLIKKGIKENILERIRGIFIGGYNRKKSPYFPDNFDSLSIDDKYKIVKKLILENKIKILHLKEYLSQTDYQIIVKRYLLEKNKN
jgi:protein-tyrosine phosphatase